MKRRKSIIAAMLCVSLLSTACAASGSDEGTAGKDAGAQQTSEAEKEQPKEKEYQGKLNLIQPSVSLYYREERRRCVLGRSKKRCRAGSG